MRRARDDLERLGPRQVQVFGNIRPGVRRSVNFKQPAQAVGFTIVFQNNDARLYHRVVNSKTRADHGFLLWRVLN